MKFSFNILGHRYILSAQRIKKPTAWTTGLTSRVPGSIYHILLMDYDMIREDYLIDELTYLQEIFELGNFYLFQTRLEATSDEFSPVVEGAEGVDIGGYHVVCLGMRTLRDNIQILRSTGCDYAFINAPSYNPEKHWVLRIAEKAKREPPKFIMTIDSPYEGKNGLQQSTFHARLLDDLFELGVEEKLVNPDGNEIGIIDHYNTGKRV